MQKSGKYIGAIACAIAVFLLINGFLNVFSAYSPEEKSAAICSEAKNTEAISKDGASLLIFNTSHASLGADKTLSEEGGKTTRPSAEEVLVNVRGIAELVNLSNADAVLLQDVDTDSYRSRYVNQLSFYADSGSYDYYFAQDFKIRSTSFLPPYKKQNGGLVTLSKRKVLSAERVSLPFLYSFPSANKARRSMLVTAMPIKDSDKKLYIINFELDPYLEENEKAQQLEAVMDYAEKLYQKDDYVVIGGSFYKTFAESSLRYELSDKNRWNPEPLKANQTPLGWSLAFDQTVPTARILSKPFEKSNEENQVYVGDGFVLSPNIEQTMVVTVDQEFRYSAHNPVLLKVKFK